MATHWSYMCLPCGKGAAGLSEDDPPESIACLACEAILTIAKVDRPDHVGEALFVDHLHA